MVGNYRNSLRSFIPVKRVLKRVPCKGVYALQGCLCPARVLTRSLALLAYLKLVKPQGFRIISGN